MRFTKEFSKSDFEAKVKENPANSHLKVEIEVKRPVSTGEAEVEVDESNKPDFLIQYEQVKKENPDYTVVAYINTTAELKTVCDVCVTSASAVNVVPKTGFSSASTPSFV